MWSRVALACFCTLIAATSALAAGGPGTARFATPQRGTAVVVPGGQGGTEFAPIATGARVFTVHARLRVRPAGGRARLLIRHKRAGQRCARTYRQDRGRIIRLGEASVDAAGFVTATSRQIGWDRSDKVRFCVWLPPVRGVVSPPRSSVITFFRDGFGLHMYGQPRDGGGTQIVYTVMTTGSLTIARADPCGEFSTQTSTLDRLSPAGFADLYGVTGADRRRCGQDGESWTISGFVNLSFSLTNEQAAAGGSIHRGSFCVLSNFRTSHTLERARRNVESQGCRVGRILSARTARPVTDGRVSLYAINGTQSSLMPQGTVVDLVVG